ncbi:hypothetical protein V8C44DRAFT_156868 [Trichoderma aethiopicum]
MHGDAVSTNPVQVGKRRPKPCRLSLSAPAVGNAPQVARFLYLTDDAEDESITRLRSPTRRSDNSGRHGQPPHPSTREQLCSASAFYRTTSIQRPDHSENTCDFAPNLLDTSIARFLHTAIFSHTQLVH